MRPVLWLVIVTSLLILIDFNAPWIIYLVRRNKKKRKKNVKATNV